MSTGSFSSKKRGQRRTSYEKDEASASVSSAPFTRSSTVPLDKDKCFFCQKEDGHNLLTVRTENAGRALREAVEISQNVELKTRLNTAISPTDAHAMDVRYHKPCWTRHVFHARRDASSKQTTQTVLPMQVACLIELINLIDVKTQNQIYLSMDDIEATYISMLGGSEALQKHTPAFTRHWQKDQILSELPSVQSVRQKDRRKPGVLYSPEACEEDMVSDAMGREEEAMGNMKVIYKTAQAIRKSISSFTREDKPPIAVTSTIDDVPPELYTLMRWILAGPVDDLQTEVRTSVVNRAAVTMSHNIMYAYKTSRQVKYKPSGDSAAFRKQHVRENPQVLGLALNVHHDTRNKRLMDLLNAQNCCASYSRALLLETALANAVVENTTHFQGLYVPPLLKKGTFVFFAVDNTDFAEDTADGKGTTHGTVTAVYQKANATGESVAPDLQISDAKNLSVTPYHVAIMPCNKPKPVTASNGMEFSINSTGVSKSYELTHLGWIIASALSRTKDGEERSKLPGWAGYNSLLSSSQTLTEVGAMSLLPEVAHEWPTLLTVMMQACQLKSLAVGEDHPTVISFDMALYEKAVQLIDARPDLKRSVVPRLGELHVVMAALRALGASMENSGIDDAWMEAGVYGSATTRQILKCSHYKRALRAHIYSYIALYEIALELFFTEKPHLKVVCLEATCQIEEAYTEADKSKRPQYVKVASNHLLQALNSDDVMRQLKEWGAQKSTNAMFKSMMNYLHRVETILYFVAASRNADLTLHLQAGEALSKMFVAMDRIKYKRLWPRYIADMHALQTDHPETWRELQAGGNISVTKSGIPFVSIGADHACEHLNRMMKVHSGLIGISNNANARQRFFMAAPELSRLSSQFKGQFDLNTDKPTEHHDLKPSSVRREHEAVSKIKAAILSHGNPFDVEGDQLFNMMTHAYSPQEFVAQILNIDDTGQKLYQDYVTERINGEVCLWAPVKKQNNKMYMSGNKKRSVKIRDQIVDLKETKDLYGRLMVLAKSSRDIDQKQAIGNHEFTLTPRALFAPGGSVLPCTDKSKLIHIIQKLTTDLPQQPSATSEQGDGETSSATCDGHPSWKIAVVDGMVLVQKMVKKPATVVTVQDLSRCFNDRLVSLTTEYDEIILVFDTYHSDSLKNKTREKRQQGKAPIQYQIRDDTNIKHVVMSRFLSHSQTKADLTEYLAEKTLLYNRNSPKLVIASACGHTRNNSTLHVEDNNHEEADTLMIHQTVLASQRNPHAELMFFSPDTDVLVLIVAHYRQLCKNTSIYMASGVLQIEPIWDALGEERAKALHVFHAFTGADNIGRFSGIGKTTWFQLYLKADTEIIANLLKLSEITEVTEEIIATLARFVCSAYCPRAIQITSIPDLRWHLFCKHLAESDKLPPTLGALEQHIKRVCVQSRVWSQADVPQQQPCDPLENGYYQDEHGQLLPVTTNILPAPKAIIEMVRCQCKTNCSSQRCSCRSKSLSCTDLCLCGTECENDSDSNMAYDSQDESDDEI